MTDFLPLTADMEGLKKDQNPLVLAVTARLCLEEKYQHHLKIFTDGSVMEEGATGAAFVIPEFNNLTHSYSLPAVSVFTAELLAISMALQHISAIPVTPFVIVICSDSKAALTAIRSHSQNARDDRDNYPPADHPRYGNSLSVGTSVRLPLWKREGG